MLAFMGRAVRHALHGADPVEDGPPADGHAPAPDPGGSEAPARPAPEPSAAPPAKIAPYIRPGDFGNLQLRLDKKCRELVGDDGKRRLQIADLHKHVLILGGSGSGKTYTAVNPLVHWLFRSTHLPPGEERERNKPGMLFIEGKGDFALKAQRLARRYGRLDDLVLVGPDHDFSYDPFGDPTEDDLAKAGKMLTLMEAVSEGRKGNDPFWDQNAFNLFLNIFRLHTFLKARKGAEFPGMSFSLLSLLISDRGLPRNQNEVQATRGAYDHARENYNSIVAAFREGNRVLQAILGGARQVCETAGPLDEDPAEGRDTSGKEIGEACAEMDAAADLAGLCTEMRQVLCPGSLDDEGDEPEAGIGGSTQPLLEQIASLEASIRGLLTRQFSHDQIVEGLTRTADGIASQLRYVLALSHTLTQAADQASNAPPLGAAQPVIDYFRQQGARLTDAINEWFVHKDATDDALALLLNCARTLAKPEFGQLQQWVDMYDQLRKAEKKDGGTPERDDVTEYFRGQFLNVANDRTAGSVAMTASQVVVRLSSPPFDRMFRPGASFTLYEIITHGRLVALDMPFARYKEPARLTSILLKADFFRAVLSRKSMRLQMDRGVFYIVDEMATVATKGRWTGEPTFLDKCREYKCGCILATQSLPMLRGVYDEEEVKSLLTNTQTRVYLRNDDDDTNKKASESSGRFDRASGSPTLSPAQMAMGKHFDQLEGHINFHEEYWLRPDDFKRFEVGECLLILPPEFRRHMIRRVRLMGDPINAACHKCGELLVDPRTRACLGCGHKHNTDPEEGLGFVKVS